MDETPAPLPDEIMLGWTFDGQGGGHRLSGVEMSRELHNPGLTWVHLNAATSDARDWLETEATYLDRIIIDALLAEETRPRTVDYKDGMLLILRGVNTNPDEQPEDMVSLRVWIDAARIITIERRRVQTVRDIDLHMALGNGPKSAGDFLMMLCGHLFEHLDESLGRLHDQLDALEEKIMSAPEETLRLDALNIRRAAITFRRYIAPQRDVLAHLRLADQSWIEDYHRRSFQEDLDQVLRSLEDLDLMRERAQITYETLNSALSQKVNRNLYLLSGIATIFMPLTFITGLFGMNVAGIPEADHPYSFALICGITIGLAILQALVFRWIKWF